MIKTIDLLNQTEDHLLMDNLKLGTLEEGSSLFLHGFDDEEYPDTIVCPYCGQALEGTFSESGAFSSECKCSTYQEELTIRKKYHQAIQDFQTDLNKLGELAKENAKHLIVQNTTDFIMKRRESLQVEFWDIEHFLAKKTN